MDQILAKLHRRKDFYIIVFLLGVMLLSTRYLIVPYFDPKLTKTLLEVFSDIMDKLFISLIVTVFIGSFVFWLTPDVMRNAKVEIVEPREIGILFRDALYASDTWWYNGGCGRYFRTKTMPEMAKEARKRSLTREVTGIILDPRNDLLCEQYSQYRRGVRSAEHGKEWTVKRVKQELISTIIKTDIIKHQEPHIRIRLSLVNQFSSVRLDLSSKYIILTKEDKLAPAIRLDAGTYFYQWYRDELILMEKQATSAPELSICINANTVSTENVKQYMKSLRIAEDYFTLQELEEILQMIKDSKSPYE